MMATNSRHPSLARLQAGITATLRGRGRDWPAFAAAIAIARGSLGLDAAGFGTLLGVEWWLVVSLEQGHVHPSLAPAGLAHVAPDVDWAALGVPVPPLADAPAPDRHPAARRPARIRVRGP